MAPANLELPHEVPQKTGTSVVECMTGPPPHSRFETWVRASAFAAWAFAGTKPDAGPDASSGLPPRPAADAALTATTAAQATARATTARIALLLMFLPLVRLD